MKMSFNRTNIAKYTKKCAVVRTAKLNFERAVNSRAHRIIVADAAHSEACEDHEQQDKEVTSSHGPAKANPRKQVLNHQWQDDASKR